MRPTFSGFYIAKQGMDVARANLQVTGQNLNNANSEGYTRQRVDTYARGPSGMGARYALTNDAYIGEGVQIRGINQLRDPYLDVRYRRENAKLGDSEAELSVLNDLGSIFDSATQDGFEAQFSDIVTQLQALAKSPSDSVSENIVKTSSSMLLQLFNNCATKLDAIKNQHLETLKNGSIKQANEYLSNISELNQAIKSAHVSGNPALELMDQRNILIDKLSEYVNIEVISTPVDIGAGVAVDELSINLTAPNGDKFNLVDNESYRQFEMIENKDTTGIRLLESNGKPVDSSTNGSISLTDGDITDQLVTGAFHGTLKFLNAKGEFSDPPNKTRGLPYYQNMMDTVARDFAKIMNEANRSADGTEKPLFSARNPGEEISAKNITISSEWEKSTGSYITTTKKPANGGTQNPDDNSNILNMISLFSKKHEFKTEDGYPVFSGTFHEFVTNMSTTQGIEKKDVERRNTTSTSNLSDIDGLRQSTSSVNIDEEGINLLMYNHALTAASRFMTTLDEAVDTIINKMGIVGR